MSNKRNRVITGLISAVCLIGMVGGLTGCNKAEKNISVVVREQGSGTREAFDKVVTNGNHFLEEKDSSGKKVYNTTKDSIQQTKTGNVLSSVANDKNSIGYISLGSVNDTIKVLKVDGVEAIEENVLNGNYKIQRPFVVMTNEKAKLTERAQDFINYVYSNKSEEHSKEAGTIFLTDKDKRGYEVGQYKQLSTLPAGDKIVVRGSTSMEKYINSAAKGYADMYGARAEEIFDIQLEGSSVGRKTVESDTTGNVIGLSSAEVKQDGIKSLNVCLDAVVVIVNNDNKDVTDLSISQLYDIFSGKIKKFSEIK